MARAKQRNPDLITRTTSSQQDGRPITFAGGGGGGGGGAPAAHHATHESGGTDVVTLAESQITNLVADLAAKAPTARLVSAGSGLTGGGDLSANRTLAADFGSGAGKVTEGNDARLTDARAPTAHTHPESDVTNLVTDLAARKLTDQGTSNTGTQNNFNLGARMTYLRCDGAAPVFTGFTVLGAAPAAGDLVLLHNTGTGTLRVAKEDTGSTAVYRITSPSARGQIVGVNGAFLLVYDGALSRWRVELVLPGAPIAVAFSAGNFTGAGSSTWTVDSGDVIGNAFIQEGAKLTWFISISTSTLGGTPASGVNIALPNGFTVANNGVQVGVFGRYFDAATWATMIFVATNTASTILALASLTGANLASGTNTFYVQGVATFLVD